MCAGVVIRSAGISLVRQGRGDGTSRDSYQGYAIAAGYFLSVDTQDYAVSVPKLGNYFGRVSITVRLGHQGYRAIDRAGLRLRLWPGLGLGRGRARKG